MTTTKRQPFPLQWPDGWKRTPPGRRERSRFGYRSSGQVSFSNARATLLGEIGRLGAANAVITSDLPTRNDGLPYASGRSDDSGIAVWFVLNGQERVFACDKWRSHAENMQAIAMSIEAMRGLDRWGMADVVTRAFVGFAALPAAGQTSTSEVQRKPWTEVFDISESLRVAFTKEEILALVKTRHRTMIKAAHPDHGGSQERAAELNDALTEAQVELQS